MSEVPLYYQRGRHACTPIEAVSEQDLLPDIEQWSRAVAPTSSRGGLGLA